jgi:CRP-like cAMP-binding protein
MVMEPLGNALLASLPPPLQQAFMQTGSVLRLDSGHSLVSANAPVRDVFFPLTAVLSVQTPTTHLESASVGREGMAPLSAFHGMRRTILPVIVQIKGDILSVPRATFDSALETAQEFRAALHRFSDGLFVFEAQRSACDRKHSVKQRCAVWLLATNDRVNGSEFPLTHQFMAQLLGIRRSSVTVAAEEFRASGAIAYTRGRIHVVDRSRLLASACECYATLGDTYEQLVAPRGAGARVLS